MPGQTFEVSETSKVLTHPDLAIAWVLRRPEVTAAIVGARSPWQIEEVAKAGDWRLTAQELAEIETLLARRAQTVA